MKSPLRIALLLVLNVLYINDAISQTVSGVVNSYYSISAINIPSNIVTVDNAAGLYNGQPVLIIQMKGATVSGANSAAYGSITAIGDAGNYEFNTICSITGNQVMLQNKLVNAYDVTADVQLVSYNSYTSVTVSGIINAQTWDPITGKGGVVVIAATNSITLNADVDVSGQGFQGGALINYAIPPYNCDWATAVNGYFYNDPGTGDFTAGTKGEGIAAMIANEPDGMGKLANGGGGGNNANSGGAGGANYGAGGNGGTRAGETFFSCHGQYPGIGGASLAAYGYTPGANRIFMGGGGGSGQENNGVGEPGANGGGIIILTAPTIVGGGGQLLANGLQPTNAACLDPLQAEGDGGGGGGAGGTIIIDATTITGAVNASAIGGAGSNSSNRVNDCTGPGGGGGGGMIWAAGASFPAAVTATVTGGVNGVVSAGNTKVACRGSANGATSGATGLAQSGYAAPVPGAAGCSVLASSVLESLTATPSGEQVALAWKLTSDPTVLGIRNFVLERAADSIGFSELATIPALAGTLSYRYPDAVQNITGRVAYRLAWQDQAGIWWYSRIVEVTLEPGPGSTSLILQPNPARDQLTLTIYSRTGEFAGILISDVVGQSLLSQRVVLHQGINTVTIPLGNMSKAVYFLSVDMESGRQVREFIKK
jgi:hypothetical protein